MFASASSSLACVGWKTAKRFPPCLWRVLAPAQMDNAALSSARPTGFALHGDSLFSNAGRPAPKKVSKNACPSIRPRLRRGSLTPVTLQGPAAKGHPWPIAALAASMPLNPFHATCARPPERGDLVAPERPCSEIYVRASRDRRVGNAKLTHRFLRATFETNRCVDCGGKCFAVFHPTASACGQSCFSIARTARRRETPLSGG